MVPKHATHHICLASKCLEFMTRFVAVFVLVACTEGLTCFLMITTDLKEPKMRLLYVNVNNSSVSI